MPAILASAVPISYPTTQFNDDLKKYRDDLAGGQVAPARILRDQIIFRAMAQIDMAYEKFEGQMTTRRAGVQTAGDAASLGVTAAATAVGASGLKDILDATSIALQGTRLSYDKNFFEQKTTESLVSQMRASRKTLKAAILTNLAGRDVITAQDGETKQPIPAYTLEYAWDDLIQYYYAGTIPSALVDIASATGSAAQIADAELKKTVSQFTVDAKTAVSLRAERFKLQRQLAGDATAKAAATATLRQVLIAIERPPAAAETGEEMLADYVKAFAESDDNPKLFKMLTAAVAKANGSAE